MIFLRADLVRCRASPNGNFWEIFVSNSAISTRAFARTVMKTSRSKQPRTGEDRGTGASGGIGYHGTNTARLG
jgi:hypothetical protein